MLKYLCKMLIDVDEHSDEIWERIERLPVVLCHRGFWVANIFYTDHKILLMDWDTTGWGYMGEDIASLIADEADVDNMLIENKLEKRSSLSSLTGTIKITARSNCASQ